MQGSNNAKKIQRCDEKFSDGTLGVRLLITYIEDKLVFQYEEGKGMTRTLGTDDTADLSSADFVGPVFGVFAVSDEETDEVVFANFEHEK